MSYDQQYVDLLKRSFMFRQLAEQLRDIHPDCKDAENLYQAVLQKHRKLVGLTPLETKKQGKENE